MGQPGVCLGCFGTGWRLLNSQGQGINTSPVYPTDGSTISFVEWGRDERHTYDASRYGNGTSPGQYMQIYSGGGNAQAAIEHHHHDDKGKNESIDHGIAAIIARHRNDDTIAHLGNGVAHDPGADQFLLALGRAAMAGRLTGRTCRSLDNTHQSAIALYRLHKALMRNLIHNIRKVIQHAKIA